MSGHHYRCCWFQASFLLLALSLLVASTGCGVSANSNNSEKTLTAITTSPSTASIAIGATEQFTAMAAYSDGSTANVTSAANWTTANPSMATVNSAGLATGVAVGSTTIAASLSGVTGSATLTVATAGTKTVTSIAVSPLSANVAVNATQQYTATATYSDGSMGNVTSTVSWTTANAAVATITPAGLATAVASGLTTITASLSGVNGSATLNVKTLSSISVSPSPASIAMGATGQFTATATFSDGSTANVTSTATWTAANTAVATIAPGGLATAVASGSTTISASLNSLSGDDPLTVTIAPGTGVNIATWHVDTNRSGLNAGEQSLSPANVSPQTFGKLFSYLVDGYVYGEPLLVSNLTINGATHNVLYAATEQDSVYAFDADSYGSGTPLWHVSLLEPGETPLTSGAILPYTGVTSTPVIDLSSNTMYVFSAQISGGGPGTFRLNALDITTGAQKFGGPVTIQASVPGTNSSGNGSTVTLTTDCLQRSALLLANGMVYIGIGSCPTGWLLAYDATTLTQTAVFNASPNLNGEGAFTSAGGIWMGSGGPVADSSGNVYVVTGNGPWDGATAWGDSVLKFTAQLGTVEDYFTPDDYAYMNCDDGDLGSGGLLLIPGTSEAVAGGKTGKLYLVNTADLGQEQAGDAGATQTLWFESDLIGPYSAGCTDSMGTHTTDINSYENFGAAAYFNGSVYVGVTPTTTTAPAPVRQFTYSGILTPGAYTSPSIQESTRGTTPFISANGTTNGILWMIDEGQPLQSPNTPTSATLRAYDATNLASQVYNSSQNSADVPGYGIKFSSPVVANGKVYISTGHDPVTTENPQGELDVYGLH